MDDQKKTYSIDGRTVSWTSETPCIVTFGGCQPAGGDVMELVKYIPARTERIPVNFCKKRFLPMSQKFREIRQSIGGSKMDTCYVCHHAFMDGEMMGLALTNKGNKVLCGSCCDAILQPSGVKMGSPVD